MLKGGHKTFWDSFYVVVWSLSHILAGNEKFPLFKRGVRNVLPCLEGGGVKSFVPEIFSFCSPHLPVINNQSLTSWCLCLSISVWDRVGTGSVNAMMFRRLMTTRGEKLTDEDVDEMMEFVKIGEKGEFKYNGEPLYCFWKSDN